ncbi:TetR/AcrR family transcriptional regulator [Amycolatopsis acidiphila]|uniref:TetR/AcrR family transcriptional regulator n=1 Tax=Amycolatopsis acidiphila TaxID=715473 RepID=A0A558ANT9_9PSEU|nr:TetR/AcrR family transcriptional regulator [Amycolatopsis acidiphila]TVT25926.1 TetR/AcrR family transcriptional regulator [Amycolatopsis acidiphila]UIJ63369.1 TetR/AcrR family transcriptional regulator [Amycolatopsis acidiphila]GHG75219.1 hypothetical protein GCM10017788_39940 [Amycolatopsis acidiphila]
MSRTKSDVPPPADARESVARQKRGAGRPAQGDSDHTRNTILDAAIKEFSLRGFKGTTLREVSSAADLTAGTLHHYFPTKRSLYEAAFEYAVEEVYTGFNDILNRHGDLRTRLRGLLQAMIDPSVMSQSRVSMILRGWVDQRDTDVPLHIPPVVDRTLRRIGDDAVLQGEIDEGDVHALLAMFRSMAWGLVVVSLNQETQARNAIEGLMRALMGTLLTRN